MLAATARRRLLVATASRAPSQRRSNRAKSSTRLAAIRPGHQPRLAVPDFLALPAAGSPAPTRKPSRPRSDRQRCCPTDLVFEREFALIPRDILNTIPPAASIADVSVRSLARGQRRRCGDRHGSEDADRRPRRDASVQRARPPGCLQPRIHRRASPASGCSRIRSPTKFISSSARCAVSPAPS